METSLAFHWTAFVLSWSLVGLFWLLFKPFTPVLATVLGMAYMLMPAAAAIILSKVVDKTSVKTLGISFKFNRYFLAAWLLPVVLVILTLGINLLFPQVQFSPSMESFFDRLAGQLSEEQIAELQAQLPSIHPFWLGLIQGLIAGLTINALFAFGEELGWRGYLLKACQPLGFWKASVFIGVIWGIWHAPLILLLGHNYPEHRLTGVGMMVIFCILLAVIHTYIRIKSGSVIAAAIIHGTINGLAAQPLMLIQGGNDLINGITGFSGFLALLIVILLMVLYQEILKKQPLQLTK